MKAQEKLDSLKVQSLLRETVSIERGGAGRVVHGGREYVSFSCNDVLGLSHHAKLVEASMGAVKKYGVGGAASRLITGNNPLYGALEGGLAHLKGAESALVFGSGYLANIGTIPALVKEGDVIFMDGLCHACLVSGARLSRAEIFSFRHNDMGHLAELLGHHRKKGKNALVLTEGVFSMEGDIAPLGEMKALCEEHGAWLFCDDAHGLGVLGKGRGACAELGVAADIQMGTLSKAAGSYGGYICGSEVLCDLLKNRARSLIYSTALPPAVLAASLAAIEIIAEDEGLCALPLRRAAFFCSQMGLGVPQSHIVSLPLGSVEEVLAVSEKLKGQGFWVQAIRPPTVPTPRLRFAFSAVHGEREIIALIEALKGVLS